MKLGRLSKLEGKIHFYIALFGAVILCLVCLEFNLSFAIVETEEERHNIDNNNKKSEVKTEMNSVRAVFVTVPSIEVGKKIAHGLVSKKLAACVNIIPQITSIYEWEGKINEDSELLLMIKTQTHLFEDLTKFVKENHPYDVPEVIALPVEQGSKQYLDWIKQNTIAPSQNSEKSN